MRGKVESISMQTSNRLTWSEDAASIGRKMRMDSRPLQCISKNYQGHSKVKSIQNKSTFVWNLEIQNTITNFFILVGWSLLKQDKWPCKLVQRVQLQPFSL